MNYRLSRAVSIVVLFWFLLLTLTFGLADPSSNMMTYLKLSDYVAAAGFAPLPELEEVVTVLNSYQLQWEIFWRWTIPGWMLIGLSALVGLLITISEFGVRILSRKRGEDAGICWQGVQAMRGITPIPVKPPTVEITVNLEGVLAEAFARLTVSEKRLFVEVLQVLAAHPDAYVGEGHEGVALLDHSIGVAEKVAEKMREEDDRLTFLVAIAHDLGKITSFKKVGDHWERIKLHDNESSRLMATLRAWPELEANEAHVINYALRYSHKPHSLPKVAQSERILTLIEGMKAGDKKQTVVEKEQLLSEIDLPTVLWSEFLRCLPSLVVDDGQFRRKGKNTAMFRKGNRAYIVEMAFRESMMQLMLPEVAPLLSETVKTKGTVARFTREMAAIFDSKGLLVKTINEHQVTESNPLWNIISGSKQLNGILIIDLTPELLAKMPPSETRFDIDILGANDAAGTVKVTDVMMNAMFVSSKKPVSSAPVQEDTAKQNVQATPLPKPQPEIETADIRDNKPSVTVKPPQSAPVVAKQSGATNTETATPVTAESAKIRVEPVARNTQPVSKKPKMKKPSTNVQRVNKEFIATMWK